MKLLLTTSAIASAFLFSVATSASSELRPYVPVSAGSVEFRGLLDTGASRSHLPIGGEDGSLEEIQLFDGTVATIPTGTDVALIIKGIPIYLDRYFLAQDPDEAVIGLDALTQMNNVGFFPRVEIRNDITSSMPLIAVPLKINATTVVLEGSLMGASVNACLDTGATSTLVYSSALRKVGRPIPHGQRLDKGTVVLGIELSVTLFPLEPLSLLSRTGSLPLVGYLAPAVPHNPICDITVGVDSLSKWPEWFISFRSNELLIHAAE